MDRRTDSKLATSVETARATLTPEHHTEAVRLMMEAGASIQVIARVIFLPHRARRRRQDTRMAEIVDRARAILSISGEQDARIYLLLKNVPFPLIQRALFDKYHRPPAYRPNGALLNALPGDQRA